MYIFVYLCDCLSVSLSVCLSGCLSVCLSVCLSDCLSVWLSVCLTVCLSVWLSVCLSDCLSVCLSVWLSVCLSICLSVSCYLLYPSPLLMWNVLWRWHPDASSHWTAAVTSRKMRRVSPTDFWQAFCSMDNAESSLFLAIRSTEMYKTIPKRLFYIQVENCEQSGK